MARAASGQVVAATFPGTWEDAYRTILTPMVKEAGYDLTIAPALAQDQIAKLMASPGQPPYDALLVSPGQSAILIEAGLIEKIDPSKLKNWGKLSPTAQNEWGPYVTIEVNGIAYNPEVVDKPSGYKALFEDPQYAGQVAQIGFGSNTATMAWTEINKLYGGTYENMQPVFDLIAAHLDDMIIATSGSNQMTMYQQGEVAVFMASTGNVAKLRELGHGGRIRPSRKRLAGGPRLDPSRQGRERSRRGLRLHGRGDLRGRADPARRGADRDDPDQHARCRSPPWWRNT